MKKNLIAISCLLGGALFTLNSFAAPEAPELSVVTNGLTATLSWTASEGADGYKLVYAPAGQKRARTSTANMGDALTFSATLRDRTSLQVSIVAYDETGRSPASNVETFTVYNTHAPSSDLVNDWIVNEDNTRSTNIYESSTSNVGVLVNIETVTEADDGSSVIVTGSGIPNYRKVVDRDVLEYLNAFDSSAFSDGVGTTVSRGDVVEFGQDVGFALAGSQPSCEETGGVGYWPPGPDCPSDRNKSIELTTTPTASTQSCETGLSSIGYLVNGTSVYNWEDGQSENDIWQRNAPVFEENAMDICGGHAAMGDYHHHFNPQCLSDMLKDRGQAHSPVYGYASDSYPIYGPWYARGVLATSSWVARDYDDELVGCEDGQRSCVMVDEYTPELGTIPASTQGYDTDYDDGRAVRESGVYYEDMYYDASLARKGGKYLDEHNGHDHDEIGYHYHITVTKEKGGDLTPAFPYNIGPTYYGEVECFAGPPGGGPGGPPPEGEMPTDEPEEVPAT